MSEQGSEFETALQVAIEYLEKYLGKTEQEKVELTGHFEQLDKVLLRGDQAVANLRGRLRELSTGIYVTSDTPTSKPGFPDQAPGPERKGW